MAGPSGGAMTPVHSRAEGAGVRFAGLSRPRESRVWAGPESEAGLRTGVRTPYGPYPALPGLGEPSRSAETLRTRRTLKSWPKRRLLCRKRVGQTN